MNIHIYPSTFTNESRILKIIHSLRKYGVFAQVVVIALWKKDLPTHEDLGDGMQVFRIAPLFGASMPGVPGKIVKAFGWYLAVLRRLRGKPVSCVNCHSLPVLPLSVLVKVWKKSALVYDTHELETEIVASRGWKKRIFRLVERSLIRSADAVSVVNKSIANWYEKTYRLGNLYVVRNLPYRLESTPVRTGLLRSKIRLDRADARLFIYQGLLSQGRGIDMLLEVFSSVPEDNHLVFMGYGVLEDKIRKAASNRSNIHFVPAVPPQQVKDYTVDADIGFAMIENVCLSYYLSLPNKLFEYAACGLPSIVSDFPEMARFVDEFNCGWKCTPDPVKLKMLVESISDDEIETKRLNTQFTRDSFHWEEEEGELLKIYRKLGFVDSRDDESLSKP